MIMDFNMVDMICTKTANCMLTKKQNKEMVRNTLITMVAQACVAYNNDSNFKRVMDKIARDPSVLNPLPNPLSYSKR